MNIIEEAKKLADANGDGSLSADDLTALRDKFGDNQMLADLQSKIDANGDGHINFSDLQESLGNFGDLGNLGETLGGLKDRFFGGK